MSAFKDGKNYCRWCGYPIPPGKQKFCPGTECVDAMRADAKKHRRGALARLRYLASKRRKRGKRVLAGELEG